MFDPKTNKFPFTEQTDQHYLKVKMNRGLVFDENYPFIDKSKSFVFKQKMMRILLNVFAFPVLTVKLGLKIKGRENLKKYKDVLKNGVISISNHVQMCDYVCVMKAIRPFKSNILAWDKNINGENGTLIRLVGGIPIPTDSVSGTKQYFKAIKDLLDNHGWLHICAEGSMWEYYAPIRPFKKGAAHFACSYDKPILPIAFSYRKPGFIRGKIFKQIALYTLTIGEPIFANKELPFDSQREDLTVRTHEAVCRLAGIDPKENIYPPIFKNDKRIDYYTSIYGVGYKGSHW